MQVKKNLLGYSLKSLESFFLEINQPKFRAKQILKWIHQKGIIDFDLMTDLNKDLRNKLKSIAYIKPPTIYEEHVSEDGTIKYLIELESGSMIEMVEIPEKKRRTLCVSSQAGCALQCTFCATGAQGFDQNLESDEIIGQLWLSNFHKKNKKQITNVVFMGMGEPFLNYKNVIKSSQIMNDSKGFNLSSKKITISTSGILPKIKQYIKEKHKYKLAISLNASNNDDRNQLIPINKKWNIEDILSSLKKYSFNKYRPIMFEYVLINGVNDKKENAIELGNLLKAINCKINIIPYNETKESFKRSQNIDNFVELLSNIRGNNYRVFIRWSKGQDIDAACGQLATKNE